MMTKRDFLDDCKLTEPDADYFISQLMSKGDPLPDYILRVHRGEKQPDSRYWQFMIDQFESGEIVDHRGSITC